MKLALVGVADASAYESAGIRLPDVAFTAVADADSEAANKASGILGASLSGKSLSDLLAQDAEAFDAVVIHESAGPAEKTVAEAALAGKHVLAPSPMASSADTAQGAMEACRSAGVILMAGSDVRFMPSQVAVKDALSAGKLGDPGLLRIHVWLKAEAEAGELLMTRAVAGLDLAAWMFSGPPTEIYAIGRTGYAQVHLGFPQGGMAMIDYALTLQGGDDYFSLSLIGSTGAAYADDHHNRNLLFSGGVTHAIETNQGCFGHIGQLREFVAAIDEKRQPSATGEDGKVALEVAEAAVISLEKGSAMKRSGGGYALA